MFQQRHASGGKTEILLKEEEGGQLPCPPPEVQSIHDLKGARDRAEVLGTQYLEKYAEREGRPPLKHSRSARKTLGKEQKT